MIRTEGRTYARGRHGGQTGASHALAIGFNAGTGDRATFGKLPGFCIFINCEGSDGKKPVDYGMMLDLVQSNAARDQKAHEKFVAALNDLKIQHDPKNPITLQTVTAAINAAIPQQMKAPAGIFPTDVEFVIPYSANREDDGWNIRTVYDDQYTAYKVDGCKGEFCCGNGVTASRWQSDGSRIEIACNPVGKADVIPEDFCPFSTPQNTGKTSRNGQPIVRRDCLAVGRLTIVLIRRESDGKPAPLARINDARFEFTTRSEHNQMNIASTLFALCERLDGHIDRVFGTLHFQQRKALAPAHAGGQLTSVGRVQILINEASVQMRQDHLAQRLLEAAPKTMPLQLTSEDTLAGVPVDIAEAEYVEPEESPELEAASEIEVPAVPAVPTEAAPQDPNTAKIEELRDLCDKIGRTRGIEDHEVLQEVTKDGKNRCFKTFEQLEASAANNPDSFSRRIEAYINIATNMPAEKGGT